MNNKYSNLIAHLLDVRNIYKCFDRGHDAKHFDEVVGFVVKWCYDVFNSDINKMAMAMTAAAFHDVGLQLGREQHSELSAKMMRNDYVVCKTFSVEQINTIARAIELHRSRYTLENTPDMDDITLLLKDADSSSLLDPRRAIDRLIYYKLDREGIFIEHEPYSKIKLWLESGNAVFQPKLKILKEHYGEEIPIDVPDDIILERIRLILNQ